MRPRSIPKQVAVAAALAGWALLATAQEWQRERDAIGLYKEPVCDVGYRIKSLLTTIAKQPSTGIKASNEQWEMEIFANAETQSWTLVGKSLAPEHAHSAKLCRLASALGTTYAGEKWYLLYFKKH